MARDITLTFEDGTSHIYRGAPDDITPDAIEQRAIKEFGKPIANIDGGRSATPAAPVADEPSALSQVGRQLGLTARYAAKGVTALPAMVGDALGLKSSESVNTLLDTIGLPKPAGSTERLAEGVTGAMAGGGGMAALGGKMMSAAAPVARNIGASLAANPGSQVALSGVSGGATEMARESGAGPAGQFAAGMLAPMAVGATAPIISKVGEIAKNIAAPTFSKEAANIGAARMMNDVSGTYKGPVAQAMAAAEPNQTAAQAALGTGSAEVQAAQRLMAQRRPSEYDKIYQAQAEAVKTAKKDLNKSTSPIRTAALDDANRGGVLPDGIYQKLDALVANPGGGRTSDVVTSTLGKIKERIAAFTDENTGVIDAKDLYDIRKKIGVTVGKYAKDNADWDKRLTSGLEREVQRAIDDAIVDAASVKGGMDWMTYLSTYSKEMGRLTALKDAEKTGKRLASAAGPETSVLLNKTENPIKGVNLLSRPAMVLNAILSRAEGSGGRAVEQAAADMMMPQNFGGSPRALGLLMMDQARRPTTLQGIQKNMRLVPQAATMGLLDTQE